jgi:predicted Zn-dependent protease with MMP-like domain
VLTLAEFELLVEDALRLIPWRFRRRMNNVAIVVEREAPRPGLLGLYQGRPLASRSVFEGFAMPDKITIFQGPHERLSRTREELEQMVADTVWHEIAHHFGMDEGEVRRAERRRRRARPPHLNDDPDTSVPQP